MTDYLLSVKLLVDRLKLDHDANNFVKRDSSTTTATIGNSRKTSFQCQSYELTEEMTDYSSLLRRDKGPGIASYELVSDNVSHGKLDFKLTDEPTPHEDIQPCDATKSRDTLQPRDRFDYPSMHVETFENNGDFPSTNENKKGPNSSVELLRDRPSSNTSVFNELPISPASWKNKMIQGREANSQYSMDSTRHNCVTFSRSGTSSTDVISDVRKPRLSISNSVPLSPLTLTGSARERQLCGVQLKLDTLKAELMSLRKNTQDIASNLLQLYSQIQVLKINRSCQCHCELLDDVIYESELAEERPVGLDPLYRPCLSHRRLLTSHGVTNFNISCRRFSCC